MSANVGAILLDCVGDEWHSVNLPQSKILSIRLYRMGAIFSGFWAGTPGRIDEKFRVNPQNLDVFLPIQSQNVPFCEENAVLGVFLQAKPLVFSGVRTLISAFRRRNARFFKCFRTNSICSEELSKWQKRLAQSHLQNLRS